MAVSVELPGMFDLQAAKEQQSHKTGYEAAQIPLGRVPIYASSVGGDIYNEGLMGLAGMLGGAPDPETAKQQKVAEIMERFPDPETSEDMMKVYHALNAAGIYDFAGQIFNMATALRNQETNLLNTQKTTTTKPDYNLQARNYYALATQRKDWTGSLDQQRELLQEMGGMGFLGTTPYNALAKYIEEEDDKIIAKEASVEAGALAISKRYADRDIITTESALSNVERLIATYDADPSREGDIPGVNWLERNVEVLFKDMPEWTNNIAKALANINIKGEGQAAQEFIQAIAVVKNMLLKKRSGAAVTESEYVRFLEELKGGVYSGDSGMRNFITQLRRVVDEDKANIMAGYSSESQNRYKKRAGIHPTLTACEIMNSKECKAEFDKLPPGSIYFVPGNDKRYQKPGGEET